MKLFQSLDSGGMSRNGRRTTWLGVTVTEEAMGPGRKQIEEFGVTWKCLAYEKDYYEEEQKNKNGPDFQMLNWR